MKRSTIIMIIGLTVQVINWTYSSLSSNLSTNNSESVHWVRAVLGYGSIVGWLVFFAGLGIRQLDKRKLQMSEPKRRK